MTNDIHSTGKKSAAVIEQSIMAFGVGMDPALREDIKNAYHFAFLVASKAFPEHGQTEQWFYKFREVMSNFGWLTLNQLYERERTESQSLKLGSIAFKGLTAIGQAALGNPVTDVITKLATDAIEGLGKVTEAQEIFKNNIREKKTSSVALAACVQNEAGEVFLAMTAIDSKPYDDHQLDTLFFEWESKSSSSYSGSVVLGYSSGLYDIARDDIRQRLQERTVRNVLNYEI